MLGPSPILTKELDNKPVYIAGLKGAPKDNKDAKSVLAELHRAYTSPASEPPLFEKHDKKKTCPPPIPPK